MRHHLNTISFVLGSAFFLLVLSFPIVVFAGELAEGTATVRINVNIQELRAPKSFWRHALGYLGIRSSMRYPAPGTGMTVHSSAYAPSPYQTDSTPCITAAGTRVRPGVVATNFLPFGTLLQIGNEVYIVEDRMNHRYQNSIDIFFPSTSEALEFGSQELDVVIIGYGEPGQVLPREEPSELAEIEQAKSIKVRPRLSFRERFAGRINYLQRFAGNLVGIRSNDVNRYDIDCFS